MTHRKLNHVLLNAIATALFLSGGLLYWIFGGGYGWGIVSFVGAVGFAFTYRHGFPLDKPLEWFQEECE